MTSDHKNCRDCGASFRKSRTDSTVRCPDCRASRVVSTVKQADRIRIEADYWEAKIAGMKARREFGPDSVEYCDALRAYKAAEARWNEVRS